jgi:hypothetical protein
MHVIQVAALDRNRSLSMTENGLIELLTAAAERTARNKVMRRVRIGFMADNAMKSLAFEVATGFVSTLFRQDVQSVLQLRTQRHLSCETPSGTSAHHRDVLFPSGSGGMANFSFWNRRECDEEAACLANEVTASPIEKWQDQMPPTSTPTPEITCSWHQLRQKICLRR